MPDPALLVDTPGELLPPSPVCLLLDVQLVGVVDDLRPSPRAFRPFGRQLRGGSQCSQIMCMDDVRDFDKSQSPARETAVVLSREQSAASQFEEEAAEQPGNASLDFPREGPL